MLNMTGGDVVWLRFPLIERSGTIERPALVLSARPLGLAAIPLLWTVMITNARRPDWPGDVPLDDHVAAGLHVPSKIRTAKLQTVELRAVKQIGRVPGTVFAAVLERISASLGQAA